MLPCTLLPYVAFLCAEHHLAKTIPDHISNPRKSQSSATACAVSCARMWGKTHQHSAAVQFTCSASSLLHVCRKDSLKWASEEQGGSSEAEPVEEPEELADDPSAADATALAPPSRVKFRISGAMSKQVSALMAAQHWRMKHGRPVDARLAGMCYWPVAAAPVAVLMHGSDYMTIQAGCQICVMSRQHVCCAGWIRRCCKGSVSGS